MSSFDSTSQGTISEQLVRDLRCPDSGERLAIAEQALVERVNRGIAAGSVRCRSGAQAEGPIDGGLIREDRRVLYPIRDGIPILLIDDSIPLDDCR